MLVTPTWFCRARSLALSHRRARRRIGSRVVAAGVDERRLTAVRLGAVLLAAVFMSLGLVQIAPLQAEDLYLSPDGNDQHAGTRTAPLKTLSAARNAARRFAGRQTVTVHVADGIYYLPETLVLGPADSGSQEHPVLYTADHEGAAIISGGSRLDLVWQSSPNGIYRAKTPPDIAIDQLFIDGQRRPMARYPNYDADQPTAAYQGFAADAFSKERAARWSDPTGGYIHAMHRSRWGGYHYRITGKTADGDVTYEGGWQNNRKSAMHKQFRMVENIFEELDAPGEWFHDGKSDTLYFQPEPGLDLEGATVEVVRLRHLVELRGTIESPVRFVTFRGFTFRHTARTFMETREPLLRSDWTIYRGGTVVLTGTENVQLLDSEFDQVGGNAVFVDRYNRRVLVKGCHIHDAGASGVCFVGDPGAVRNPLFEYSQKNDLATIDRTPGPKTENFPAECTVTDCLIHGIGRVERQPAGVLIDMAQNITISDTSIYDCARAGINIGDGCWGGHLIDGCDVFDTVLETNDHGSFNSWGRDRYWRSDHLQASQAAVDEDRQLPFLDAMETTVIRNSRWRCDHGWDIDLDDGSSNYDIYNNLMLHGGLKFREGFRRRAWNNITINNGFHPHVWFNHSQDEVFGNIFMAAPRGARMPGPKAKGKRVDGNFYFSSDPKIKDRFLEFGWDVNSVVGDPQFLDPEQGDFRVQPSSPAATLGFKSFAMDRFGVKKPSLKSIARTPQLPNVNIETGRMARSSEPKQLGRLAEYWLGAKLHDLAGQEYSAYGTAPEEGGVAILDVIPESAAADAGLRENDLVQALNQHPVRDRRALLQTLVQIGAAPMTVRIVREQETKTVDLRSAPFVVWETAETETRFQRLTTPPPSAMRVKARPTTHNDPLSVLTDGRLQESYGPVFGNTTIRGVYKMDLATTRAVSSVTSWSYNQNGNRGRQRVTIYGSRDETDPGWNVEDRAHFTPLGTLDTTGAEGGKFQAVSLRAATGRSLGNFHWIAWRVLPVTGAGENSAFQEFHVE